MSLDYHIRRSARAKWTRIVVSAEKIEVVAPLDMPNQHIEQFVHSKQAWIATALKKVRLKKPAPASVVPRHYQNGALVPYQGGHYPLVCKATTLKNPKVELDNVFIVHLPVSLAGHAQGDVIKVALMAWMKQAVKLKVMGYIQQHAPRWQLFPTAVRIKAQTSRWGSCSGVNAININWRLILAPPVILEYVVVHELCHIQEKNHSVAFWQLVATHMPDYQQHRGWLKQYGASLMRGL